MAGTGSKMLGPLEAEAMEVLWRAGEPLAVREVLDHLNEGRRSPLAYTTVMTVLVRLAEKGALRRQQVGRGYQYEAVVDDAAGMAVKGVLRDFGDAALAHFVEEARADPRLRKRLQRLMGPDGEDQRR